MASLLSQMMQSVCISNSPLGGGPIGKDVVLSLGLPEPSSMALTSIFSTHIKKHFMSVKFPSEVLDCISQLVSCAINVYKEARAQLLPSPGTPQYIFCIRDLSKVEVNMYIMSVT